MMAGGSIDKGSAQARLVMEMIDSWLAGDLVLLEFPIGRIGSDYGEVFWLLILSSAAPSSRSRNTQARPSTRRCPGCSCRWLHARSRTTLRTLPASAHRRVQR